MDSFNEAMAEAKRTYEWNAEKTNLIRKSDRAVVAEILKTRNVWAAKNTSGKTRTIGNFESPEAAREAVKREFGLRPPAEE